ncbi:MAG: hypothetical protein WD206_00795 [Actinomycetota bacterium]
MKPAAVPRWMRTALVRGALAFAAVTLVGQAVALAVWIGGGPGSLGTTPRIGWLYTCSFLAVPLDLLTRASGAQAAPLSGGVAVTLLTGTAVLVWAAWDSGRRAARVAGEGWVRVVAGASVGPVVGVLTLAGCVVVGHLIGISVSLPRNPVINDVQVQPELLAAFVWPTLLAGLAGAAGGLSATSPRGGDGRALLRVAVEAGTKMLLIAMLGALGFALLIAATRPDATAAYVRTVTGSSGAVTAAAVGHHVLALPNQSVWLLAVATGGCDEIVSARVNIDAVCLDTLPEEISLDLLTPGTGSSPATRGAPWEFLLLPLVPLAATVAGGVHAARASSARWPPAVPGAAAGVVFGLTLGVASLLSGVTLSGALLAGVDGSVRYGPDPWIASILGLAWGLVGGGAGSWLAARYRPQR